MLTKPGHSWKWGLDDESRAAILAVGDGAGAGMGRGRRREAVTAGQSTCTRKAAAAIAFDIRRVGLRVQVRNHTATISLAMIVGHDGAFFRQTPHEYTGPIKSDSCCRERIQW